MFHDPEQRHQSIQSCWECRNDCQETLFNRSLDMGGRHLEERHVKLMLDCIAVCQTAADMMTRHSSMYDVICGACAKICMACAESCQSIGGAEMIRCADSCRACAACCARNSLDAQSVAA